jgi:hypothetical protein
MWPEWLKEGLSEITPIPGRMELDYLFRMRPKVDSGSAKRGLCASSGIRIVSYVRHISGICLTYSKFVHMSGIYLEYTSMPKARISFVSMHLSIP